jgi:hypothetical protein
MMQRFKIIILSLVILSMLSYATFAIAGPGPMGGHGPGPYGGYCEGPRWGWYGARTPVTNVDDARKYVKKYFEGRDVVIGTITEQNMFFKADIRDHSDTLLDQVIIHKRSGRIRSIF